MIHRDRDEQQRALHQSYRPVFQSEPVFGRSLADAFLSQQKAMNAAIRLAPHAAVQSDQRNWLERRILWWLPASLLIWVWVTFTPFV